MKKLVFVLGLMLALTVYVMPQAYAAENGKTAVVDFNVVINDSEAGKKANVEFNELLNARRAEVQEKAKSVQDLKKALDEQAASLSAEDKKSKVEELNKVYGDYRSMVATYDAEVQKKRNDLRSQVMQEIKEVLNKIAQEEKYTMIFDAATVPYYDKSADISAKVIQKYNESKK